MMHVPKCQSLDSYTRYRHLGAPLAVPRAEPGGVVEYLGVLLLVSLLWGLVLFFAILEAAR